MDTIFIHELKVNAFVGIYEHELLRPQTIQIDVEMAMPHSRACESDAIEDTIDYAAVVDLIREKLATQRFSLLEKLAEQLAQSILRNFGSPWMRLSVAKLEHMRDVRRRGVCIERSIHAIGIASRQLPVHETTDS